MKKFLSIFVPVLAGVLSIAYLVCSILIPQETVTFMNQVGSVLNYPITVAGVTVTLGAVFLWFISNFVLKNTKFGKKELSNMHNDINEFEHNMRLEFDDFAEKVNSKVDAVIEDAKEFKNDCDNRVTVMINQFELLQNNMLSALKTIPNKKVQEIIAKYEAEYEDKKAEFIQKAVDSDKYLENKLNEMFKKFMSEVEEKLNEREEAVDNQTEEE